MKSTKAKQIGSVQNNRSKLKNHSKPVSNILKRGISLLIIFSILVVSVPAAPETIPASFLSIKQDTLLFINLSDWLSYLPWMSSANPKQETQEDRDAQVVRIEVDSNGATFPIGRVIPLSAVAYDQFDNPVAGVRFEWTVQDNDGAIQDFAGNMFTGEKIGEYKVTAHGANIETSAKFFIVSPDDKFFADKNPSQMLLPFDEWTVNNFPHAGEVKNLRGNSPGKPMGKTNFNIVAPILSIPGRSLNLDLNLDYNSQVWSKVDQDISYDMDKDWLSPGWSTGFGKIVNVINGGIMQVDANGTRRFYAGNVNGANDKVTFLGQSTDGTFIKTKTETSVQTNGTCFYNPTSTLKYPDGTTIFYTVYETRSCYSISEPITMVPISILDRFGNAITITYHTQGAGTTPGRWINQVTDTLGRVYTFNYTLDNNRYYLSSITGQGLPDENGQTVTRTFIRLQYKNQTISHNFTGGLTAHVRESNIKVLSAIYYPATQSGYWFGDSDSYSSYGMIRKVDEQRAMNYSAETGITSGTVSRRRVYSYHATNADSYSDVPFFYTSADSWEGMTNGPNVTTYDVDWDAEPRTTTTIASDGSKVKEYSFNKSLLPDTDPEKAKDGLTYKTEVISPSGLVRTRSEIEWELGSPVNSCPTPPGTTYPTPPGACVEIKIPRQKKIVQSEYENGQTFSKITLNEVFGEYNQVLESKETGYGGINDVIRKTVYAYVKKGDSPTTGDDWRALPRLINLPTTVEVFDGAGNRLSYSKNEYDVNTVKAFPGTSPTNPPQFCTDSFCNSITGRGNISKTTSYENVTTGSLTGEIVNSKVYDRTGNLVEEKPEITANTLISTKFTSATAYAYPEETVTGSDNPNLPQASVKTTFTYNLNTGLPVSTIDSNQQPINFSHNPNSWRLVKTTLPTGGSTNYIYDDVTRTFSKYSLKSNNELAGKQISKVNGLGKVMRQEAYSKTENGQDIFDVVETQYDEFGRIKKTSNPFRNNVSANGVYWSEVFYDDMGRVWKSVAPDGSTKYDFYNESAKPAGASSELGPTHRMKDPIGREKWFRNDSDGNLVEVIEPNPDGNGSVATGGYVTKYSYDKLKRLTQIEQESQVRKLKYDSLGRVTHQKMAESNATLDNNGNFVGAGNGQWSDFYTYNKFSNVTSSKDARGVTTNYSYTNPAQTQYAIDPLNRLFSVSYNTNGATDVLSSPTVNYTYRSSGDLSQLSSITTTGVNTLEYDYDLLGRVKQKKNTILSRSLYPMYVNYTYDSLNRVTDITYPDQYGTNITRKNLHYDLDISGRMTGFKVDNNSYASDFAFNNFNQITSVKVGPSGTNQITQTYSYNQQTGLLENQKVLKGGSALLDLSYEYQRCSCSTGGSGQVTKIINNLDRNRDRAYEYDALARLKKVSGGINQTWSQSYTYDRYGNKKGTTSSGVEAFRDSNAMSNNGKSGEKSGFESSSLTEVPTAKNLLSDINELTTVENAGRVLKTDKKSENNSAKKNADSKQTKNRVPDTNTESLGTPAYSPFDFDNDDKADISVWQKATGTWAINKSSNGQNLYATLGSPGDQIAPGDYDGDGKADTAVWRPSNGAWYIIQSSNGAVSIIQWGLAGDSIMPADYDGDGKTDLAVWRPSTGVWYVLKSAGGFSETSLGGQAWGDIPVAADYDNDNKADIAVWRPSTGTWYIIQSSNGQVLIFGFGASGDVPVPADYDGDGKADYAVWRPSTGAWYLPQSSNGQVLTVVFGGLQFGDVPVSADYDGDGKTDIAVWRPSTGVWYYIKSSNGQVISLQFGNNGDIPVPSAYRRRSSAPKNQNQAIPRDGHEVINYDESSNRILGFTYDLAGNQTRTSRADGYVMRYQYDAAGRLVKIKDDNSNTLVTYTYGESRERLIAQEGNESSTTFTYYAWDGGAVVAEYIGGAGNILLWAKNYIYMGEALLATHDKNGTGENLRFNHADRLGTRIVTNPADGSFFEQNSLPFGTALESESSGSINTQFTSYDRSGTTKLDYAINRFYDSSQGRFTAVDPIKMKATDLKNPQTLNLYAYTANDPVNRTDPDGQFWGFLGTVFGGLFNFLFSGSISWSFNFNIRGVPINFGFQGHFKNIYVGIAGFTVQVTGRGSISSLIKNSFKSNLSSSFTNFVDTLIEKQFTKCGGGENNDFTAFSAAAVLNLTGWGNPDKAAMVYAFWGRESNWVLRGTGDHGPMQLTSWWKNNHPKLIVKGAYDSFTRPENSDNRMKRFTGDLDANFQTGLNIINFSLNRYNNSFWQTAYHYGPGDYDTEAGRAQRTAYANDVNAIYEGNKKFWSCFSEGVPYGIDFGSLTPLK